MQVLRIWPSLENLVTFRWLWNFIKCSADNRCFLKSCSWAVTQLMSPLICPAASWCCTPTAVVVPFSNSVTSPSSHNCSCYRWQDHSSFHHHICWPIAVSCEGMKGLWQNFQLIYPLLETKGEKKRLCMDVRRQNVCLVVIFCHLVEGLSGIFLAPGSTAEIFRYSFSLTELFIFKSNVSNAQI